MKIILNKKQLKVLNEQNPDNEETLTVNPLVVNYRNIAVDNFRVYFNNVSGVSEDDKN